MNDSIKSSSETVAASKLLVTYSLRLPPLCDYMRLLMLLANHVYPNLGGGGVREGGGGKGANIDRFGLKVHDNYHELL